jgi:hypothetical protein
MKRLSKVWPAILAGLFIGFVTSKWGWLAATVFTVLMLVAYAYLFPKPKAGSSK